MKTKLTENYPDNNNKKNINIKKQDLGDTNFVKNIEKLDNKDYQINVIDEEINLEDNPKLKYLSNIKDINTNEISKHR